jgi:hypothetical protein
MTMRTKSLRWIARCALCFLAASASLAAQDWKGNPRELVRQAVRNEDRKSSQPIYFMYRDVKRTKTGEIQTREMLQTPTVTLGRILAINGHSLSAEQKTNEDARLNRLTDNDELQKKIKQQSQDEQRARKMVAAIPEAFTFQYVNTEKTDAGEFVVFKFSPDPNWNPPDRELQVFTGMEGTLKIALPAQRIALMDAHLFRAVDFGWGIFGRLNAGGHFLIEQKEVYAGHWDTTHMSLHFTGKVLLVKSLDIQEEESTSDYHPIGEMSVATALDKLKQMDAEYGRTANGGN